MAINKILNRLNPYQKQQAKAQQDENLRLLNEWYTTRHLYNKDKAVQRYHRFAVHRLINRIRIIRKLRA